MISPQRAGVPAPLSLSDQCIYLAPDRTMRSYAKTAEFFRNAGADSELADGNLLALHHVATSADVHYPIWEMHPEGDELLLLASGSLMVEFRDANLVSTGPLRPFSAIVVPAGVWHRLIVQAPSTLIAITPRRNTVHERP
jgi:mannose-6-phosphate isomerase-like protein (cupin superfamily)